MQSPFDCRRCCCPTMMMRHAAASSPCACASADQKIGKPDNQKCAANLREACSHTLLLLCEDTARHSDALHPLEHAGKHGSSAGDRPAAPSPAPRRCCPRTQRAAAWPPCPLPCVWPWLCACPCCVSSFSWHREQLRPPPAHASRAPNEHAARRRRHQISARSPYRTVAQACLHEAKSVCQQDRRCASPGAASRRPLSATPTQHAWRCGRRASGLSPPALAPTPAASQRSPAQHRCKRAVLLTSSTLLCTPNSFIDLRTCGSGGPWSRRAIVAPALAALCSNVRRSKFGSPQVQVLLGPARLQNQSLHHRALSQQHQSEKLG